MNQQVSVHETVGEEVESGLEPPYHTERGGINDGCSAKMEGKSF